MRSTPTTEELNNRRRERQKAYEQSEAGKATRRKYRKSAKGREVIRQLSRKQEAKRQAKYGALFTCVECKQELQIHQAEKLYGVYGGVCRECSGGGEE